MHQSKNEVYNVNKTILESKKAIWSLIVVVLTFCYLAHLLCIDAPWEAHDTVWTFLTTLSITYLGSQAVPDAASAYSARRYEE